MATAAAGARARIELGTQSTRPAVLSRIDRERQFYAIAAFVMLAITLVGFRAFLLRGHSVDDAPMTQQIVPLIVTHGLAMLTWVVLLCVQSVLIVSNRKRLHIALGTAGIFVAGAIVVFGLVVAPLSAHFNPPAYDDFGGARYFLALMWPEPVTFGLFVTIAYLYRFRPEMHRPMTLIATIGIMTGSLARLPYEKALQAMVHGSIAIAMFGQMILLGAIFVALNAAMTRRLDRYLLAGLGGQAVIVSLSSIVARTHAWDQIASLIVN